MKFIEIKEFSTDYYIAVQQFVDILVQRPLQLTESYFKELIESDNSHLFLLVDDERILGMLTIGIYKSPTGTKAWIEDVVVDKQYQACGYGKAIMQHAIEYVKQAGASSLMLTSNPLRVVANKLYQTLGFEQRQTNVYQMKFDK